MKKILLAIAVLALASPALARNGDQCINDMQCVPGYCAKGSYGPMGICVGGPSVITPKPNTTTSYNFEWPDK